jgi:hypothetical protein
MDLGDFAGVIRNGALIREDSLVILVWPSIQVDCVDQNDTQTDIMVRDICRCRASCLEV